MAHAYLKRPFFLPSFSAGKFHIFKQPVTKRKKKLKLFQNCEMIFFYQKAKASDYFCELLSAKIDKNNTA